MGNKAASVRDRILKNDKLIFYVIAIFFFIACSNATMFGDDTNAGGMRVEGGNLAQYWARNVELYETWSSRIIVNFFVFFFTDHPVVLWGAYMGLSMYVLLYAFSELFVQENRKENNIILAGLVMLFPFPILSSAGWIATATTFLSPAAFGFLSFIPIRKVLQGQRMKWWEYILYALSLLYGANNEQMMVVVLGAYGVAAVYFLFTKRMHPFILVQFALAVVSFLIIALCPGNKERTEVAHIQCFPNWGMFSVIDKAEMGYSTTMQWVFFGSNAFTIAVCLLIAYLVWARKKDEGLAVISALPAIFAILFGPLNSITTSLYPKTSGISEDVNVYGLVTTANRGDFYTFGKYFIWAAILVILCISLLILQESLPQLLACFTLLGAGMATRVAIGFSPTIYASEERTFTILILCIIAVACCVYENSVKGGYVGKRAQALMVPFSYVSIILSMVNLYLGMVK